MMLPDGARWIISAVALLVRGWVEGCDSFFLRKEGWKWFSGLSLRDPADSF